MQGDSLRQGETAANVFFNILASRLYKCFIKILNDRGALFAIADDVKIAGPRDVLAEIIAQVPALSMSEAGLKTQAIKNRVYVPPSARTGWIAYLEANPRLADPFVLCLHDILDGRLLPPSESEDAFYNHEFTRPS